MGKSGFSLGQAIISKAPCFCKTVEYTAPLGGGDITISRAALLTAVSAQFATLLPAGMAYELQNATVATYSKGTEVVDEGTDTETVTSVDDASAVTCGGQISKVNPYGGKKQFGGDVYDADCDGESDNLLAADFQVVISEGSAIAVNACVTPVTP